MQDPTVELVDRLRPVVARHTRRTPLVASEWLGEALGAEVWLKCENLQVTGSFKARGAVAALAEASEDARARGVVTASTGNHGQALARAARLFGTRCTVVVPRAAPATKRARIRGFGAELREAPAEGYDAAERWAREHAAERGAAFVSAFEDAAVIAGNGGTSALEVLEDAPELDLWLLPAGGAGLVVGAGLVARARRPATRVVAVNAERAPALWRSRRDGRPWLELASDEPTLADGVEGGVGAETFRLSLETVDDVVLAREASVLTAMRGLLERERLLVEGAGALGVAALLDGAVELPRPGRAPRVGVWLTGANVDLAVVREIAGTPGA